MTDSEEETSQLLASTGEEVMEARNDHQMVKRFRFLYWLATVIGLMMIMFVFIWIFNFRGGVGWIHSEPSIEFNWHPLLMTIGFIFLYAQSMLVYRIGRYTLKRSLKLVHAAVHFIVFIITVIALKAVFDSHDYAPKPIPNMYSLHSWIGLITVILFSFQYVAGFVTYLFPGLSIELRTIYMHVHTSFGTAGFVLALISAFMGLTERAIFNGNYAMKGPESILINFIGLFMAGFGGLVLYLINENSYKRTPLPEDNMPLAPSPVQSDTN